MIQSLDPRATVRTRRSVALAVAAAALVLAACGGSTPASGDVRMGAAVSEAVTVVLRDNTFEPATLQLDAGSQTTIEVSNAGERAHNLVIDEIELSTGTLESGDVATATFNVPDEAVTFYCSFHPDMKGRLEPASG